MEVKTVEIMCSYVLNRSPSDSVSYQVTLAVSNWRIICSTPRWPALMHSLGWGISSPFISFAKYVRHLASISYPVHKLETRLEVGLQQGVLHGPNTFLFTVSNGWGSPRSHPWPPLIPIISLWLTLDLMSTRCWKNNLYYFILGLLACLFACFLFLAKWVYGLINSLIWITMKTYEHKCKHKGNEWL